MTNDERSRLVAEAMGWRKCPRLGEYDTRLRHRPGVECGGDDCDQLPYDIIPDLADARDREQVIAWLVEQGYRVEIAYTAGVADVRILRGETRVWVPRPTIEDAFGQAVLAAIGGEQ